MKNLSVNIREIMGQMDDLFDQIKPVIDGSLPKKKELQSKAIEKVYSHYSGLGIPLPQEFLDLKESCLQELGQMAMVRKEYPVFFNFLQDKLKEVPLEDLYRKDEIAGTEVLYQASFHPEFLQLLIDWGTIKPGTILERNYNNKKHEAKILVNGKIELIKDDFKKQFDDVHSAASHIVNEEVNGLDFWQVRNPIDNSLVRLSVFLK